MLLGFFLFTDLDFDLFLSFFKVLLYLLLIFDFRVILGS